MRPVTHACGSKGLHRGVVVQRMLREIQGLGAGFVRGGRLAALGVDSGKGGAAVKAWGFERVERFVWRLQVMPVYLG